jgi:hypothetical protein
MENACNKIYIRLYGANHYGGNKNAFFKASNEFFMAHVVFSKKRWLTQRAPDVWEPLLSFGHLPLKGKTPRWECLLPSGAKMPVHA